METLVLAFGESWITAVLLLGARIAAMLLLTPVLYAISVPPLVRIVIVLGLAAVIAMPFAAEAHPAVVDPATLVQAVAREVLVGSILGLGILMAFGGFALAGRLVDVQIGYGIAQVFDPLTRTRVPILSSVFGVLAAVFFFIMNGHHALLRGLAYSVDRFPIGQGLSIERAAPAVLKELAALFALGFALAAPVVLSLLLLEFALGVISRNLPQMNMLVMGLPLKIVAGLLALSLWAAGFSAPAGRLYAQIHATWNAWFAAGELRR